MNTDGHNGFHFTTVSPGMSGYPDKFIHLDDVVPVDTTPPTEPTDVRAAAHRGRTVITWRASSDTCGVAGYRVFRNGVPLGDHPRHVVPRRQPARRPDGGLLGGRLRRRRAHLEPRPRHGAARHGVGRPGLGLDRPPGRRCVAGPATTAASGSVAGCWSTGAGAPSSCHRTTTWGDASTRAFLPSPDGSVSYCRPGRRRSALSCTALDPDARVVGRRPDVAQHAATGRRRHLGDHAQPARPAAVSPGPAAAPPRPARCSPSPGGTRVTTAATRRGAPRTAAPSSPTQDGAIAFCRWLPGDARRPQRVHRPRPRSR